MSMKKPFDEHAIQSATLASGLRIFLFPKRGFSKYYAVFATNFGAVDSDFTFEGERGVTPAGVAHFLEHKVFEQKDENALQKYARTGASPNAFTSNVMTAYHFECADSFYENLEILLRFVTNPYFTDENVQKEQGIIGQEIGMVEDTPDWVAFCNMFDALYHEHPVRESIIGTVESIGKIDKELLYRCHRAFYSPNNMVLVVAGDAELDRIVEMAQRLTKKAPETVERHYGNEPEEARLHEIRRKMAVSMPVMSLGFKDAQAKGARGVRRQMLGELATEYFLGTSSALYEALYERGLINRNFEAGYEMFPETAVLLAAGESANPGAVRDMVLAEGARIAHEGVDAALFERVRRSYYGMRVRRADSFEALCIGQVQTYFAGAENVLDFTAEYESITAEDVRAFIAALVTERRAALSVVEPA